MRTTAWFNDSRPHRRDHNVYEDTRRQVVYCVIYEDEHVSRITKLTFDTTPRGAYMGLNVYVIWVNLINAPYVKWVRICIFEGWYSHHWGRNMWFGYMNVSGYLNEVILLFKELFCNSYI